MSDAVVQDGGNKQGDIELVLHSIEHYSTNILDFICDNENDDSGLLWNHEWQGLREQVIKIIELSKKAMELNCGRSKASHY